MNFIFLRNYIVPLQRVLFIRRVSSTFWAIHLALGDRQITIEVTDADDISGLEGYFGISPQGVGGG